MPTHFSCSLLSACLGFLLFLCQVAHVVSVLLHLPPISDPHRLVLNQTLQTASQGVLISVEELTRRQRFADRFISWVENLIPGKFVK